MFLQIKRIANQLSSQYLVEVVHKRKSLSLTSGLTDYRRSGVSIVDSQASGLRPSRLRTIQPTPKPKVNDSTVQYSR